MGDFTYFNQIGEMSQEQLGKEIERVLGQDPLDMLAVEFLLELLLNRTPKAMPATVAPAAAPNLNQKPHSFWFLRIKSVGDDNVFQPGDFLEVFEMDLDLSQQPRGRNKDIVSHWLNCFAPVWKAEPFNIELELVEYAEKKPVEEEKK